MLERIRKLGLRAGVHRLGPGLITGAADDDPSGIATYSQVGAQFGFAMLWTVVFTLHVDWWQMAQQVVRPQLPGGHEMLLTVVAVFGTTISPYLFFWQAAQEMEDVNAGPGRPHTEAQVRRHLRRIKWDTITGTGMLAVPVLAGSAAYAVAEAAGWQGSMSLRLDKGEGRGFYGVVAAATLGGVALCFTPTDPVKELFWAAVINGVIAVPIMAVMMLLATRTDTMGEHVIGRRLRWLGWLATTVMAATVIAMFATA